MLEVGTANPYLMRALPAQSQRPSTTQAFHHNGFERVPAARRKRARLRRRLRLAAFCLLTLTAVVMTFMSGPDTAEDAASAGIPLIDRVARATGFGIDEVVLTGHRNTSDQDIYEALDLDRTLSLASFKTESVRRRLERLPWIAAAEMTRIWPGRLEVRVVERRPFAVWRQGEALSLVDETGRVLTAIHRATDFALPRISGEAAPQEAKALMLALQRFPAILREVAEADRVGQRRWSLHLKRGGSLELPPDGELSALALIESRPELAALVTQGDYVIDVRIAGRTAIRRGGLAESGDPRRLSGSS